MEQRQTNERVAQRFPTEEAARIEIYGKKHVVYCRMHNLSLTGAYFEIVSSNYTPKVGEFIRITITLKKIKSSRTLNAEVIWSKGHGMGVAFIKQKDLIGKFFR